MIISIITATFNSQKNINKCLDSIANQTYKNIEHIIIDGASTDKTLEIINEHSHRPAKIISEPDSGVYEALNKGIKNSTGDVIGFLHSDDSFIDNNCIELIANEFIKNKQICAVYGDIIYISSKNENKVLRFWKSQNFNNKLIGNGWMPPHTVFYVKRNYYDKTNYFDTSFKISADYFSILKMFNENNFTVQYIPQTLLKMRMGGASNGSLYRIIRKTFEDWKAIRKMNYPLLRSMIMLLLKNLRGIKTFIF